MLATVDITVKAPDMFTASRHVQRLADNFLDDIDDFQRASRAADRRAMSHFDEATGPTYLMRPRRSISISRIATRPSDYYYVEGPRVRATSAEPRYTTYTSGVRPVTVVGSRYHHYTPYYYHRYYPRYHTYDTYYPSTATYYSDYPFYTTPAYKYWPYTSGAHYSHYLPSTTYYTRNNSSVYDYTLPTSGLRASVPSWDIGYRPLSLSRWYSHSDLVDPLVVHPSSISPTAVQIHDYSRHPVHRMRFGSVPPISPAAAAQYRRPGGASRVPPPPISRYVTHYYSDLTEPTPINTKYVYHSPVALPPRPGYRSRFYRIPNGPNSSLDRTITAEVMAERRRIDRKMDDLLSYKLPDASIYDSLKSSLRKVHDKMDVHRSLLDRYSAIDMKDGPSSVEERVASKCRELGERMAR
ncbi:hypothetical protein TSMEX_001149 [Taenia solium]|eukprot:TsM_000929700 transcript=TsM_000929700 gene=TsM_000929700